MSTSALARPASSTTTTATSSASSVPEALAAYVASAMARIDHAIAAATFVAPTAFDDRAARLLAPLTETLAGLAMGTVVSAISAAVRRSLGGEVTAQVAAALAKEVARYEPRRVPALAILDDSPARSFGAELTKRLRARIALELPDTRRMLAVVATIVAEAGPVEAHAFERILAKAAADPMSAEKYARDLQRGWDAWCGVVANTRVDGQTALWTLWSRRVRNEKDVLTPSTAEVVAAGFIARIG